MKKIKLYLKFAVAIVLITSISFCRGTAKNSPVKNIETFARLYGYVKYFYPGDEAAKIDWNRFAVYGVKKVEKAKDSTELEQILKELFLPIAPALDIHESNKKTEFSSTAITPPDTKDMKVVTWQHLGVGFGGDQSIYKSIRLNRKNFFFEKMNFGTITASLDALPYRNKEFKLKAAVKVAEGEGHMWSRVDRENGARGFFDNMDNRPIQPGEWNDYEIKGMVDQDATHIFFGCFLKGTGKLWVDDFQFYVKNQNGWEPVTIKNPDFEEDTDDSPPAGWGAYALSYSFKVTSETAAKGNKSVSIESTPQGFTGELFGPKATFGETVSKELGSGLSCAFPLALYGTEEQTYPPAPAEKHNALTSAIGNELPKELSANDLYVRLGDVIITWNIFQHFFPYFDVVGTDWKTALTDALTSAYNDKTDRDFLFTLKKFTAALKDGHVRVSMTGNSGKESLLPLVCEWIEGQPVVVEILDKNITNVRVGDILTEISGVNAIKKLETVKQYISAATDGWLMYRALTELLIIPDSLETPIKVEREGGEIIETTIKPVSYQDFYKLLYNGKTSKPKKLKDGVYYLDLGNVPMEEINRLMPELEKARAIICDLRGYPKSNHDFIRHLLKEKDTSTAWMKVPRVIYPDYEKVTYEESGWGLEPLTPALTAKIVFLTDGRAISYAESYMGFIEHYKLATIVGQPTAGTNGNINPFQLPGGYYITWTGMRVVKHEGSRHHGVGIIPNVRVERTIKGVREGRDEFLEKALEIIGH